MIPNVVTWNVIYLFPFFLDEVFKKLNDANIKVTEIFEKFVETLEKGDKDALEKYFEDLIKDHPTEKEQLEKLKIPMMARFAEKNGESEGESEGESNSMKITHNMILLIVLQLCTYFLMK